MSDKMKITCDQCGKKFYRIRSRVEQTKHHFCSAKCHNNWMKGKPLTGNTHYKSRKYQDKLNLYASLRELL